jgi:hypothetical protein
MAGVGAALVATGATWNLLPRAQAAPDAESKAALTQGFQKGTPDYKAIGPLAFSPSGVLYFADDQGGAVFGVDLGEKSAKGTASVKVPDLGTTLAARLGTTPAGIEVKDAAVSPVSGALYLSVRKTDGADQNPANPANYALFAVQPGGEVSVVDLKEKPFARVAISGQPSYAQQNMGTPRVIGDIAYLKGRIVAAALSTEAFKSNLVSIPVPFRAEGIEKYATSIYHVAHKRQETASPVQTLTSYRDGDKEYLVAAYICTPLVRIDPDQLKAGETVTGTTVAELGSGNRPMALLAYGKPGEQNLLLNNSSFGVLKVDSKIVQEKERVNQQTIADRGDRGSKPYEGIHQQEALKGAHAYAATSDRLLVVKKSGESLELDSMPLP